MSGSQEQVMNFFLKPGTAVLPSADDNTTLSGCKKEKQLMCLQFFHRNFPIVILVLYKNSFVFTSWMLFRVSKFTKKMAV